MIKNIIFPIEFNHFTGGMIHSVVSLAKHLKTDYNVYFLAHKDAEILTLDNEIKSLVLERPWSISISKPIKTFRTYLEVRKLLKPFDFENTIVFTNNVGSELILSGFGFFPISLRRVFVSRGGDYLGKSGWVVRRGFKSAYKFIAISERQKEILIKVGVPKILISKIHNGVKVLRSNSSESKDSNVRSLSIIGYLNSNKNQLLAIDALSDLILLYPDLILNIYGEAYSQSDKAYKRILEKKIVELNLKDNVIFKGYKTNHLEIFNNTDILISCSKSEGFGRSVAEAMGYGIPCIGLASSGGLLDIITNNHDGILIENNSDSLINAVSKMINDKSFRDKISANALQTYMMKFTEEIMIKNYYYFLKTNFK